MHCGSISTELIQPPDVPAIVRITWPRIVTRGRWFSRGRTSNGRPRASVRVVSQPGDITSVRQAAAVCNVSAPVVQRWLSLGLISGPPWTLQQLHKIRDQTDPDGRRRGTRAAHGTMARWNAGCSCARCRQLQSEAARARGRRKAQERLPLRCVSGF